MKKYSYIPKNVPSRPISIGGRRIVVDQTILEKVSTPTINKVDRALKPYSVKNYEVVVLGGKSGSEPTPTTTTSTTNPPIQALWNDVNTNWEVTGELWNTI